MLRISRALAIAKLLLLLSAVAAASPNVVVVVGGGDDLGGKLAEQGARWGDFHGGPDGAMRMAELLVGRPAFALGVCDDAGGRNLLRPSVATLAGRFRKAGYATAYLGGWPLGEAFPCRPEDRGFDKVAVMAHATPVALGNPWVSRRERPWWRTNDGWEEVGGALPGAWFEAAGSWLDGRGDEPFLLWLACGDPGPERDGFKRELNALLERLEATNTIVVRVMEGRDGQSEVAFRWPGRIPGGRVLEGLAGPQDLAPTLAALCGAAEDPDATGEDWSAALLGRDEGPRERVLVQQTGGWPAVESPVRQQGQGFRVFQDRWRLEGLALFDRGEEPRRDRFAEHPHLAQAMLVEYGRWWERVSPGLQEAVRIRVGETAQPVTELTARDWWPSIEASGDSAPPPRDRDELRDYLDALRDPARRDGLDPWCGHWKLQVARAGHYRVVLSLLPATAPEDERAELGTLRDGVVELLTRRQSLRGKIGSGFQRVQLGIDLDEGVVELEAWFGGQLPGEARVGAFFATLERVGERRTPKPELDFEIIPENR